MEILFKREDLLTGLGKVGEIAASKNTLPILSNILVRASGGDMLESDNAISLFATNLEVGVSYKIDGEIKEPGEITIPARKFVDIVKELSTDDEPVQFKSHSTDRIDLVHGKSKFRLVGLPTDEFPPMPEISATNAIEHTDLLFLLSRCIGSVSTEETRHFLNGVYWQAKEGKIVAVGTDGKRLAVATKDSTAECKGVIIPATAINRLLRIFDGGQLQWGMDDNQMVLTNGEVVFFTRLIDGEYPDYNAVLTPVTNNEIAVFGSAEKLTSAIRRVALMSNPKTPSVKLEIGTEEMRISTQTPDLGEAEEVVPVTNVGSAIDIALNSKYLLQAISYVQGEVCMKLRDSLSPVLVKGETDEYVSVVMPMRL